jgi:hypothetical protein
MKRQAPLILVFLFGFFMIWQYFVPHASSEWIYEFLLDWIYIIGIIAMGLAVWSMFIVAVEKVRNRGHAWGYAYVSLAGLFAMMLFGFTARNGDSWGWYFVFVATYLLTIFCIMQAMVVREKAQMYGLGAVLFLAATVLIGIFDNSWGFHFMTQEGLRSFMFRHLFDYIMMPIMATVFSLLAFFIASAAYRAFRAHNLLATLLLLAALIVMLRFNPYLQPIMGDYMARLSSWLMNVPNLAAQRAIIIGVGLGIVSTALKVILGIERGYMGKG